MILSVSRRTDIPAFYSDWFFNRIRDGYVLVRNPMNYHQVSRVPLSSELVDCIVFWTKNPAPMMNRLDEISRYNYFFQFTLNSYGKDIEPKVPSKLGSVCDTFIKLSEKIGSNRIIWRYDPIIVNKTYSRDYHVKYFNELAGRLHGSFDRCVISFVDLYRRSASIFRENHINKTNMGDMLYIAQHFAETAAKYGFGISTCAEEADFSKYGIGHSSCIDDKYISKIIGRKLTAAKDKNQREACGCIESIDIGLYNSCPHDCKYCYANYSSPLSAANILKYDPNSPLLCGVLTENDRITERKVKSLVDTQLTFI